MDKTIRNNYEYCYNNLCIEFGKHKPEEMYEKSGAKYDRQKRKFSLIFLNEEYEIYYPHGMIILKDNNKEKMYKDIDMIFNKMMILSYLCRCTKSPRTDKWVPYRDLDGVGDAYNGFALRGINKIKQYFSSEGELFLKAGIELGGKKINYGDVGIEINIFPNVPVRLILFEEDEEFKSDANILYDYSATKELHIEDLAGLCSWIADVLIRTAENIKYSYKEY